MKGVLGFLVSIVGTSRLDIGNHVRARGLAALILAAGLFLALFYGALRG